MFLSKVRNMVENSGKLPDWIGRLLCRLGIHDYQLIEEILSFGAGGQVQKVRCRRCGFLTTRNT
jgi:hypothetical protein